MNKLYHLSSCSTCKRIIAELNPGKDFVLQDIKIVAITAEQLDEMAKMAGSYEALFSKIARKYRSEGLHEKQLTENDYRNWILNEYTFLKRPVVIVNKKIFVGNSPKTMAAAKTEMQK